MGRIRSENRVKPFKMMLQGCRVGLKMLNDMSQDNENLPMRSYLRCLIKTLEDGIEKAGLDWPIVAYNFAFPSDLLQYFNVVPVPVEAFSYAMSAESGIYYDVMNSFGHPHHTCTAQKGVMGMMLERLLKFDLVVTSSAPCDNAIGSYPAFKYLQEKTPKIKILDMPYYRDERTQEYFTEDLIRMRDEVGKALGQEPDEQKFREAIKIENKNVELVKEIHELKKAIPCPIDSIIVPIFASLNIGARGMPERTEFLAEMVEYTKENYRNKIKPTGEEKIRTIWPNMTIYFDPTYCDELDKRKGLSVLFDIFTYIYYDPINLNTSEDDVIRQLAQQCLDYPMTRQVQGKADQCIEDTLFLCREYKADAAIFTNHIACKSLQPMAQLLREVLRDELGIPFLTIDVDVGDREFTPLKSIKRKINTFVKTLF